MADLTQTAANVGVNGSNASILVVQAGEALTQGQPVYLSSAKYYKCDVNDTAAKAAAVGIVLTPAATDGYVVIAVSGDIDLGATLTVGEIYVVSESGAIGPASELTSGDYPTILGTADAVDNLPLDIKASGVVKP